MSNAGERNPLLNRCRRWGLLIGLAGNGAMVAIVEIWHPDPYRMGPISLAQNLAAAIGVPMLSLFYASTLARVYLSSAAWRARLRPFGAVGRTALTNYLMQSMIFTTLYNSWGFGLFGAVSPILGVVMTVIAFAAQVVGSVWHVGRFAFGPIEWLWRILTYGRVRDRRSLATTA